MKKKWLFVIPILIILVISTQFDDDLSSNSLALINKVDEVNESESYIYLIGIYADFDADPVEVGRNQLEEYRKLERDEDYQVVEYPSLKKIPLPEGEFFCRTWEDSCLETLFTSELNLESLVQKHKVLIERVARLHSFEEFSMQTKPSINEVFPPYQYVSKVERINVLSAVSLYKKEKDEEAVVLLLKQFYELRRQMELQDNLVGKLIYLMKLSEIIDVTAVILNKSDAKIIPDLIPRLSLSEKEFDLVSAREFGTTYHTFKSLDKHPEFWQTGGEFPGWVTRIAYKPNMTVNAVTPIYLRLIRLSKMSPNEFANELESVETLSVPTSKLRNYVGSVLIGVSPEYDEYVARFMDFDTKIEMFNQIYHYGNSHEEIDNPYYDDKSAYLQGNTVCFNGPLEDKRKLRCMQIKIE